LWSLLFLALFIAALVSVGALIHLLLVAVLVSSGFAVLWLIATVRLLHGIPLPMGPGGGGGGPPPDGGGVREPRRPLPLSPTGAAALPIPVEEVGTPQFGSTPNPV
jgi:hypothetical protein